MYGMMNRNYPMPAFNPWQEMAAFERAFFGAPHRRYQGGKPHGFAPLRTDVIDGGDHYLLVSELPGFDKQDITVEILEDTLTVQAKRSADAEQTDSDGKLIRRERSRGFYKRSFDISGVDAENITAKYADGILRLTLPKLEQPETQARRLEIE